MGFHPHRRTRGRPHEPAFAIPQNIRVFGGTSRNGRPFGLLRFADHPQTNPIIVGRLLRIFSEEVQGEHRRFFQVGRQQRNAYGRCCFGRGLREEHEQEGKE